MLFVPHGYSAQLFGILSFCGWPLEFYYLIYKDVLSEMVRQRTFLYGSVTDIVLMTNHKEHIVAVPMLQKSIAAISTVGNHNAMRPDINFISRLIVGDFTSVICTKSVRRQS